jgi:hypothetical protein
MKRKLAWVLMGFLTLTFGGGVALYVTRPDSDVVNPANCARIKKGMTIDDVKGLLGEPEEPSPPGTLASTVHYWTGKRGFITVQFDFNLLATRAFYSPNETSLAAKLRMWLGW